MQQANADVEAPLHSTRVLLGEIAAAILQPDHGQHLVDATFQLIAAQLLQPAEEPQVLSAGQVGVDGQFLRNQADVCLC